MTAHSLKKCLEVLKCPRMHVAKRHHRLPDPKSPWLQFGIDFHAVCEGYLVTGQLGQFTNRERTEFALIDPESHLGRLARASLTRAPQGAHAELNQAFALFGRDVECHIDWVAPDWAEFGDWKSSGGLGELTDATLHADMQANWQAHGLMVGSGQSAIRGRWTYADKRTGTKERPQVVIREASGTFKLAETTAFLERTVLPAFRLVELFDQLGAVPLDSVPHDAITGCGGTGKWCPYLGHCRMQPSKGPSLIQLRRAAGL